MSSGQSSHKSTFIKANANADAQPNMANQDVQPESGTVREDDIRQSSPAAERVNDKSMEAPEEA